MGHMGGQICIMEAFVEICLETQIVIKKIEPDKKLRLSYHIV